jgi:predicted TIM-barrel fold metal-dependent hydrolase
MTRDLLCGELPRLSRRELMHRTALAGGGLALASLAGGGFSAAAAEGKKADLAPIESGAIDAHVHVWTPDLGAYPLAEGWTKDQMKPPSFTPEELFAHAGPAGVGRVVLIQMSFYGFDNSYMTDTIARFPGRFAGVAVVDTRTRIPAGTLDAFPSQGVRGFRIRPREGESVDAWLAGEGMKQLWEEGPKRGLAMCGLLDPSHLPAFDAMCEKHPDTVAVIDHFARIGMDGQVRRADLDALARIARHKNAYVKVSAYYALGQKAAPYTDLARMVRRLREAYGPERLMWASDCPFQVQEGHTYADSIALIRDRLDFLTADDREWMLRKTAQKVFFPA